MLAADAAEITHQYPLGWLSSALEAHVIYRILQKDSPTVDDFKAYLSEGYDTLLSLYPNEGASISQIRALLRRSILPEEVKLPESLPVGLPSTLLERRRTEQRHT